MNKITVLGIDLAKNIFQLHGADDRGKAVLKKKLNRQQLALFIVNLPKCTVAMEACGGSHYWARKFQAMGHEVKLISPQFVKPFVKSNKNDAHDAEAIVEAAQRPNMRFVAVKSVEQQDALCLHRVRERLIRGRTALVNEIRGLLHEYGVVVPQGIKKLRSALPEILEQDDNQLSDLGRKLFSQLYLELCGFDKRVEIYNAKIEAQSKSSEVCQKIMKIPGVGPLTATAIVASVGNAKLFTNGRQMSAWLGLVPKQSSSGGKENLLGISKRGDSYIRKLLIHGARAVLQVSKTAAVDTPKTVWLKKLEERRGFNKACVALANKNARVIWKLLATDDVYRAA